MSAAEENALADLLYGDLWTFSYVGAARDGFETVDREDGDNRRWTRLVTLITQVPSGTFYRWSMEEPLTETSGEREVVTGIDEVERHEELVPRVYWTEAQPMHGQWQTILST